MSKTVKNKDGSTTTYFETSDHEPKEIIFKTLKEAEQRIEYLDKRIKYWKTATISTWNCAIRRPSS